MNRHILVTGASGFVGRHVVSALLSKSGVAVTVVGRNEEKFSMLLDKHPQLKFVEFDISQATQDCYAQLGKPDSVIHLAWDGLPNYTLNFHFDTELPKQYNFLKKLIFGGLQNLLVAGTCFEYGMKHGSLREDLECSPSTAYGFAKASLLNQLRYLKNERSFKLCWARLFYSYGTGQASGSLYSLLCAAIERGDLVFNMSAGEQLRDFLPIEEVARHLVALSHHCDDLDIVNVCSGEPISVRAFAEKIVALKQSKIQLNLGYYGVPSYEPMAFWGDAAKLRSLSF